MPSSLPFVAVLFDMDGTLVDTEPMWQRTEQVIMAEYGATWTDDDQALSLGGSTERVTNYMADLIAATGQARPNPEELAAQFLDRMSQSLRTTPPPVQPGVQRLLQQVRESGIPTALVSSSQRVLMDAVLDSIGRNWFDLTISANDVQRHKPDPQPYLQAAQQLGVDPNWALALEDSPTGAESAQRAGAFVVGVEHMAKIESGPRRRVEQSLADVELSTLATWFEPPTTTIGVSPNPAGS